MDDSISRQAIKEMLENHRVDFSTEKDYRTARACVNAVPPAEPEIIRCRDCVNYKDHRCTVANHHVSEKESCADVFGAKRRD